MAKRKRPGKQVPRSKFGTALSLKFDGKTYRHRMGVHGKDRARNVRDGIKKHENRLVRIVPGDFRGHHNIYVGPMRKRGR